MSSRVSLLVALALTGRAAAQPSSDPIALTAQAAREPDPARATALWRAAAVAHDSAASDPSRPAAARLASARAAVMAWTRAVSPPPQRTAQPAVRTVDEQPLADAIERLLSLAPAGSVERAEARFHRGRLHDRAGDLSAAVADYRAVVEQHAATPVARYAVPLWLDGLQRAGRLDELFAAARALRTSPLVVGDEDLAAMVTAIEATGLTRDAEAAMRRGPDGFTACAALYRTVAARAVTDAVAAEAHYNAGVCAEAARDWDLARAAWVDALRLGPRPLARRAQARLAAVAIRTGDPATAASLALGLMLGQLDALAGSPPPSTMSAAPPAPKPRSSR